MTGHSATALTVSPFGGDERVRTDDPLLANQVLSQLSYTHVWLPRILYVP